jgi:hypothetical protein
MGERHQRGAACLLYQTEAQRFKLSLALALTSALSGLSGPLLPF